MSAFCLYAACIKPAADKNARSNCPQKLSSGGYACNKIKSEYNINVFSAGLLCLKYILQHAALYFGVCRQQRAETEYLRSRRPVTRYGMIVLPMKRNTAKVFVLFVLFLLVCGLTACRDAEIEESATAAVTERVYVDPATPTAVPEDSLLPLLTPRSTGAEDEPDFYAEVITVDREGGAVAINLDGDSVDIVKSVSVLSVSENGKNADFRIMTQQEVENLEAKYQTSVYLAVMLRQPRSGIYTFELSVIFNDDSSCKTQFKASLEF